MQQLVKHSRLEINSYQKRAWQDPDKIRAKQNPTGLTLFKWN